MIKADRAKLVSNILNEHYPETPVPLDHESVYTLLIAVLLSAQCTDERVNKVTPALFDVASCPEDMSKVSQQKIYEIIKPCGLGPKKSSAILELSKILVKQFSGQVPRDINELEKLPGVGHKTASVVISQGFGIPAFPVDTHIPLTKNSILNDILQETAHAGDWKTINKEAEVKSVTEDTAGLPDHLANAFTKDYSGVMQKVEEKEKFRNGA